MSIDWNEITRTVSPTKSYDELCRCLKDSFAYPFVRATFNLSLPALISYTQQLLGGDARGRFTAYAAGLIDTIAALHHAGVRDVQDLMARTETPAQLENCAGQSGVAARDIAALLKYLRYWVVPMEKPLIGLVPPGPSMSDALKQLRGLEIRTNLELLQRGITPAGRQALAGASGLSADTILELVNRADFSRLPWASKATISNIMGAGYGSLAQLAHADPEQLYADFFRYGKAIGKNLKLGNEIENSYRIAGIMPPLLQQD